MSETAILETPLHALHVELGARMAPFAGYDMPIQYPTGMLGRASAHASKAGLFDVSHMGQAVLEGPSHEAVARFLETLCPADLLGLAPGRQRYTQLLNEAGGVVDDLMVARPPGADGESAARRQRRAQGGRLRADRASELPKDVGLTPLDDRGADRPAGAARGADARARSRAARRSDAWRS